MDFCSGRFGMDMVAPNMEIFCLFHQTHAPIYWCVMRVFFIWNDFSMWIVYIVELIFLLKKLIKLYFASVLYTCSWLHQIYTPSLQLTARTWKSLEDIFWGPSYFRGELLVSGSVNTLFRLYHHFFSPPKKLWISQTMRSCKAWQNALSLWMMLRNREPGLTVPLAAHCFFFFFGGGVGGWRNLQSGPLPVIRRVITPCLGVRIPVKQFRRPFRGYNSISN